MNSNRIASATFICIEIDNVRDFTSGQQIPYLSQGWKIGWLILTHEDI